jgi:hypothetical protein
MNHLGDTNKMVSDTPRMKASAHDDGAIYKTGCDLERELNAANQRIKRLEEALSQIANQDYRGNRSTESQIAFNALKEAKL